jgi:hypothetical protein
MTIRDLFTARLLGGSASVLTLALAGCARPAPESAPDAPTVALAPEPVRQTGAPVVAGAPDPEPAVLGSDLTGKELARVLVPDAGRPQPGENAPTEPKPRAVPARVLDPDATTPARYVPPPVLPPKPVAARPANPAETVPVNFGAGADDGAGKPTLPVAPLRTERARDVNLPPPAPTLGRPAGDRVSLDDPTGELGNAEVVAGVVKTPLAPSEFLKVSVPDPFELAEQVKPKVPAVAEPSAVPVPVNPERGR